MNLDWKMVALLGLGLVIVSVLDYMGKPIPGEVLIVLGGLLKSPIKPPQDTVTP
jgi:membrane protein DedA with SNARE-associated domain